MCETANVEYGVLTGANGFFAVDEGIIEKYKIGERFLYPVLQNTKDVKSIVFNTDNLPKRLIYVEEKLEANETDGIAVYVSDAEKELTHKTDYLQSRQVAWYCLPRRPTSHIAMNYMVGDVARFYVSDTLFTAVHNLHLICAERIDSFKIAASANSMVSQLIIGVLGRATHGGGLMK